MMSSNFFQSPGIFETTRHPTCITAAKLTGAKRIRVRLPDGSQHQWNVSTTKELERMLNTHGARGGVLQDAASQPTIRTTIVGNLVEGPVYDVLPPGLSQPSVKNFTLLVPGASGGRDDVVGATRLTDGQFQGLLQRLGLLGVCKVGADTTKCFTALEDLEDNATYQAVYAGPAPMDTVVRNVEAWRNNASSAVEDSAREALMRIAKAEHPAATVRAVCTKVFADPQLGCAILELDAAVVVTKPDGKLIAYLAECKNVLYIKTLAEVKGKWATIRGYVGTVPELATYFAGCEEAELFACGKLVGEDATEMSAASNKSGVRLLLWNGEEYSIGNSCVV